MQVLGRDILSSSDLDFDNIDKFNNLDDFSNLDPPLTAPPTAPLTAPPLLDGITARRSQQVTFSQLLSQHQIPTSSAAAGTRGARGEARKKSKKLESQEAQDSRKAVEKAERKLQRAKAAVRRKKREDAPRKEDISQLADLLRTSSPIGGDDLRI